jgi:Terminase large subunit, T4likevirus-type, N-terminal
VSVDLGHLVTPRLSAYVPHVPTDQQVAGLVAHRLLPDDEPSEVFYGGAAGGGKTDWLLMGALEWVDVPGYSALLLRRTFAELALPGSLMDRSKRWLTDSGAHWNEQLKRWAFPSGATLAFGYLETDSDLYRYQSAEFQMIGFDELTQFTEAQYTYLFPRLRRPSAGPLADVPLRMCAASNPGGIGHGWVKKRFPIDGRRRGGGCSSPRRSRTTRTSIETLTGRRWRGLVRPCSGSSRKATGRSRKGLRSPSGGVRFIVCPSSRCRRTGTGGSSWTTGSRTLPPGTWLPATRPGTWSSSTPTTRPGSSRRTARRCSNVGRPGGRSTGTRTACSFARAPRRGRTRRFATGRGRAR